MTNTSQVLFSPPGGKEFLYHYLKGELIHIFRQLPPCLKCADCLEGRPCKQPCGECPWEKSIGGCSHVHWFETSRRPSILKMKTRYGRWQPHDKYNLWRKRVSQKKAENYFDDEDTFCLQCEDLDWSDRFKRLRPPHKHSIQYKCIQCQKIVSEPHPHSELKQ